MNVNDFLVRSPQGKTHAIDRDRSQAVGKAVTYCAALVDQNKGWQFTDVAISPDAKGTPSCKKCRVKYLEPYRKELREIVENLECNIHEFLSTRIILVDTAAIKRFAKALSTFFREEQEIIAEGD